MLKVVLLSYSLSLRSCVLNKHITVSRRALTCAKWIMRAPRWAGPAVGMMISVRDLCINSLVCRWNSGSMVATGC